MASIKNVLIVDDDPDDVDFLCKAIHQVDESIRCIDAWNGEEALMLLQGEPALIPDLIFADLNMPRVNGKEFLQRLKKDERFRNVPVVIYSTSAYRADPNELKAMGAKRFFYKALLPERVELDCERHIAAGVGRWLSKPGAAAEKETLCNIRPRWHEILRDVFSI